MRVLFLALLLLSLSSCSALKGYEGPERADQELSHIYVSLQSGLSLDSLYVDDQYVSGFRAGIKVLPGSHQVRMAFSEFDKDCEGTGSWRCYYVWNCFGEFSTQAGSDYKLKGSFSSVIVFEDDSTTPFSALSCETREPW